MIDDWYFDLLLSKNLMNTLLIQIVIVILKYSVIPDEDLESSNWNSRNLTIKPNINSNNEIIQLLKEFRETYMQVHKFINYLGISGTKTFLF